MEKRKLGGSGLMTGVIGFGAWGIGGPPFWSARDEQTSVRTIQTALDLGINLVDTAPVYGMGRSEEIVAKAVAGRRDEVIIATKCGLRWTGDSLKDIYKDLSPASIIEEVEDSLRRLNTDRIDLYQVHWPDQKTPVEVFMTALGLLKAQGKILNIGVSNFDTGMMEKAVKHGPVASLQPKYNVLERDIEQEIIPFLARNDIGVLAYSPLASGLLTGKYSSDTKLEDWRGRGNMGLFKKEVFPQAMARVEKLKEFASGLGVPLLALALRWVISRPQVTCALVGANSPEQIKQTASSLDLDITEEDLIRFGALAA